MTAARPLNRGAVVEAGHRPPVRIVHFGLGAFARSHQAWYTSAVDTGREWGIAAFTGRSPAARDLLAPQDGLFTLLERSADGDRAELVSSVVEVHDGADLARFVELLAAPTTAIVTLSVTEAGYRLRPDGAPDERDPVVASDIAALSGNATTPVSSALGRVVAGLHARWKAGAGPLAVVPCDNMPGNGALTRDAVLTLAGHVHADLPGWIERTVSFVSTSVDRITPRTRDDDRRVAAQLTGWDDAAPVVAEPFTDWVLSGDFPAGRPAWEHAGARFVDDIEPFERRKLWLLNGAHSLLAYLGLLRGHDTVAEAIADPRCHAGVERLWDEAARQLPAELLDLGTYRSALLTRFANPRIEHRLSQIAEDGVTKLRVRIVPVLRADRAEGRVGDGAITALAAWTALRLRGHDLPDAHADAVAAAARAEDPVRALVGLVEPAFATDPAVLDAVRDAVRLATEPANRTEEP